MRPYILDESRWRALLKEDALSSFGEVDFFDPKVLSNDQLLFATQIMKKPWFELFLFDPSRKSSLQNITKTPLRDEGGVCVSPSKGLFSFRSGNSQEVRSALEPYISYINKGENVPGFIRCIWIDENTFVGVSRAFSLRTAFFKCTATKYRFSCTPLEALKEILHFTSFVRVKNRVGVVGMGTNGGYRRPFLFNEDLSGLLPIDLPRELEGDILDVYSFDGYRVGSQSRYGLFDEKFRSMDSWGTTTLFRALQIGPDIFGIVSSTSHPKHPALLQNGAWVFQGPAKFSLPVDAPSVNEIWIESKDSDLRYQGFLFEGKPTSSLIVWLHGGPKENVSPRYNPYFHALVNHGYAVLALNYPGSTGRGWAFESRFHNSDIVECLQALYPFFKKRGYNVIVPWSISSGVSVLEQWVRSRLPISAAVSQASALNLSQRLELREQFELRNIPYFSARGLFDRHPGQDADYLYRGGHDITDPAQFTELITKVSKFLDKSRSLPILE